MTKVNRNPSFREEELLWKNNFSSVAGLDEVGRGAFAGPLVAASVILPQNFKINGIRDSKLLSVKKRELLNKYILEDALFYAICEIDISFINEYGVGEATHKAFNDCLNKLKEKFDFVLVDGFRVKNFDNKMQKAIIHGDSLSVSIASASIIAKVYRDNLMVELHQKYPEYNFLDNKGYGTKYHRDALKKYGLSEIHRTSFNLGRFIAW